MSEIS
jgi:hypothetical protein